MNINDTTAVGSYPSGASPYGALDMAGDVFEWVADWISTTYYQNSPSNDPKGPESGDSHGDRGGSWKDEEWYVRSAYRGWDARVYGGDDIGFRCAAAP